MNLYNLTAELQHAVDNIQIDDETGEVKGFEVLDALDAEFDVKAETYALTIKNLLAFAGDVKTESDNLRARGDAAKKRAEAMKNHLAQSMTAVGKDKITTSKAALSFRKSTSVSVLDDIKIPDNLCKIETIRKPDKTAIGKLLKAGEYVPGAELVENMNLQIE